jgi:hypothetical protein
MVRNKGRSSIRDLDRQYRFVCMVVAAALAAVMLTSCSRPSGQSEPVPQGSEVAAMFLRNRDKLRTPSDSIKRSFSLDLAGVVTPLPGNPSKEITLDFLARNAEGGPELVVAAVIPYEAGNPNEGSGAKFFALDLQPFTLAPGENRQITIRAIRERSGPSGPVPTVSPPSLPFTPAPPENPNLTSPQSGLGISWLSAAPAREMAGSQMQPPESPPSPLFDPAMGLKVLVVVGEKSEVGESVLAGLREVEGAEFAKVYGAFSGLEIAIPVPPSQLF